MEMVSLWRDGVAGGVEGYSAPSWGAMENLGGDLMGFGWSVCAGAQFWFCGLEPMASHGWHRFARRVSSAFKSSGGCVITVLDVHYIERAKERPLGKLMPRRRKCIMCVMKSHNIGNTTSLASTLITTISLTTLPCNCTPSHSMRCLC